MAQSQRDEYPFSTPSGDPIPLEIIKPYGLIRVDFTDEVSAQVSIPTGTGFLVLRATTACYMRLGGSAAIPAAGDHIVNLVFVDAGEVVVIDHALHTFFTVIQYAAAGVLHVQTVIKYTDVRKSAQMDRA